MDSVDQVQQPRMSPNTTSRGSILLFGLPRSGTTWLGKLLDSHPDTLYRHEPDTWRRLDMPRYPALADSGLYATQLQRFVDGMPQINALRVAGKKPLFAKSYLSRTRARFMRVGVSVARVGSQVFPDFPVLMHRSGADARQRRMVWKSIESLGRLGIMLDVLDDAFAIQILRHPCGYISSVLRGIEAKNFSDNTPTSEDYGIFEAFIGTPLGNRYDLTMDYVKALTPVERQAWRWVLVNEKAMLDCQPSTRWLCVRYEDICQEPLAGVQRIFDFVGLTMSSQTREFIGVSTTQSSSGYYSVYRDSNTAAWRWRDEMDVDTVARIMAIAERSRIGRYYLDSAAGQPVAQ